MALEDVTTRTKEITMISKIADAVYDMVAAFTRVLLVFMLLIIGTDAGTRMYYSYMPISQWLDFTGVRVYQEGDEAMIEYARNAKSRQVATYHRSLITFFPTERLTCTKSSVAIMETQLQDKLNFPLSTALSENCPELLDGAKVEGVLRVSYIFDFPYGVKRFAIRYSNPFGLQFINGKAVISEATNKELRKEIPISTTD